MTTLSQYWPHLKQAFSEWNEDKVPRLAGALAYYTMLSIAPLLIICLKLVGVVFGEEAARGQVQAYVSQNVGTKAAESVQQMIASAGQDGAGVMATVISLVILLFSASGVFGELQDSLNTIWEVKPKPGRAIVTIIKDRFFSFTLVLGVAFLLLVSLVISTVLAGLSERLGGGENGALTWFWEGVHFVVSLGVITALFALIYKYVPDVKVSWRDVWAGAIFAAILFTIGKFLLGWYLGRGSTTSLYGAAGSLVALVIWVYYASQSLLLGAEFTQVTAHARKAVVAPTENAVPVTEETRAQQGIPRAKDVEKATVYLEKRRQVAATPSVGARIAPLVVGLFLGRYLLGKRKPKVVRKRVIVTPPTRFDQLRAAGDRYCLAEVERALVQAAADDRAPNGWRVRT